MKIEMIVKPKNLKDIKSLIQFNFKRGIVGFCELEEVKKSELSPGKVSAILNGLSSKKFYIRKICKILDILHTDIEEWRNL